MKMLYRNGDIYHGTNITLDLCLSKKKKKKKSKAYLPTLFFFSGKEPETQLFFFLALVPNRSIFSIYVS